MRLKLNLAPHLKDEEKEFIESINDGKVHVVKLTTNALNIEADRRDARMISALKGVKVVYKLASGGSLIVRGHLCCSFRHPFGGEFVVMGAALHEDVNFDAMNGVIDQIEFSDSYPDNIASMQRWLQNLKDKPDFVFNFSQFDEFMEIFEFYKALSSELNNNTTYRIARVSQPYYFVPIYEKEVEVEEQNQVLNSEGIVVGHTIEDYQYEMLTSEQKDCVKILRDITINGDARVLKKIRSFSENLYVSDKSEIDETNVRFWKGLELVLSICKDETVVLSVENSPEIEKGYLHLYDMGQKVKLESIENSLRLIHQGNTGAAAEMLEYIIGDRPMPSVGARKSAVKEKYASGLDPSQKEAFYMATDGSPVSLIKGPPGTGKTYVINAIVQYITKHLKERLLFLHRLTLPSTTYWTN